MHRPVPRRADGRGHRRAGQPNVFYIGVNNGGVWKTTDYGRIWTPIFDDQPTGSIGALAVAPSNPDVIYVGSGEGLQRPDLSIGDGVYKSTDGGKTWKNMGLRDGQQIPAIIVDPNDPDRVFVAVLGHPYGANAERGVFRSTDGGKTWEKVLYKDENTGGMALAFDPTNAQTVYAVLWAARQGPWENGAWQGPSSGLFKSTDGGTTWKPLTKGLPTPEQGLGRIGFAVARTDPKRLYAMVDAPRLGGLYRSDDAGERWQRVNTEQRLWGRGSDFAEVKVDPKNKDVIYVANTASYRSDRRRQDVHRLQGRARRRRLSHHLDQPRQPAHHPARQATRGRSSRVNGGETWSFVVQPADRPVLPRHHRQPVSLLGLRRPAGERLGRRRQPRQRRPDHLPRLAPGRRRGIRLRRPRSAQPGHHLRRQGDALRPPHRPGAERRPRGAPRRQVPLPAHRPAASSRRSIRKSLYFAGNVLFKTTTGGQSWDVISPDLSREKPEVPESIGIFRTPQLAKQPRRGVIYTVAPSYKDANTIWCGTDDGLIHVTRDGGKTWTERDAAGPDRRGARSR